MSVGGAAFATGRRVAAARVSPFGHRPLVAAGAPRRVGGRVWRACQPGVTTLERSPQKLLRNHGRRRRGGWGGGRRRRNLATAAGGGIRRAAASGAETCRAGSEETGSACIDRASRVVATLAREASRSRWLHAVHVRARRLGHRARPGFGFAAVWHWHTGGESAL